MPNESDTLLDFTGIRYYDGYVQAWASGAFATKEELDEIRQQAARAYHFCGSVPTVADLPVSAHEGDVYNIGSSLDGDNFVWAVWPANPDAVPPVSAGSGWDKLGATVDLSQYLTWKDIATLVTPGVMSPEDKAKLDSIEPQAKNITVDSALNSSSSNPVRNSVLTNALNQKLDRTQVAVPSVSGSGGSNGAMTAADKEKLDSIESGANYFSLGPATASALGGVIVDPHVWTTYSSGGSASGDAQIPPEEAGYHVVQNAAVYSSLASKVGTSDYASASYYIDSVGYDDRWVGVSDGIIRAADYAKLESIESGANAVKIDLDLNSSSTNPVQNQAIYTALTSKVGTSDYASATSSGGAWIGVSNGIITSDDYAKLQGIESGANYFILSPATPSTLGGVIVDVSLNSASENPVQNKAVDSAISAAVTSVTNQLSGYVTISGGTAEAPEVVDGWKSFVNPISGDLDGNAGTATKLASARTISLVNGSGSGAVTIGAGSFDGSTDTSITVSALPTYSWNGTSGTPGLVPAPQESAASDWLLQADGTFASAAEALGATLVHLVGDGTSSGASAPETINGVKEFRQSPLVAAPSPDYDYNGVVPIVSTAYIVTSSSFLPTSADGATSGDKCFCQRKSAGVLMPNEYSVYSYNGTSWSLYNAPAEIADRMYLVKDSSAAYSMVSCFFTSGTSATLYSAGGSAGQLAGVLPGNGSAPCKFYECNGGVWQSSVVSLGSNSKPSGYIVNGAFWLASYSSGLKWTSSSVLGSQAVNVQTVKSELKTAEAGVAGGRMAILKDASMNVNYAAVFPQYNVQDLGFDMGSGVHPGFVRSGGVAVPIYAGKYETALTVSGGVAICVPGASPVSGLPAASAWALGTSGVCAPMPNAQWAARALWTYRQKQAALQEEWSAFSASSSSVVVAAVSAGVEQSTAEAIAGAVVAPAAPHPVFYGNTNSGRDAGASWQTGIMAVEGATTTTGTGPLDWMDDGTPDGLADMAGNVWEFVAGARVSAGEIQIVDGLADLAPGGTLDSLPWQAIAASDGSLVAPGTPGTLKYGGAGASIVVGTDAPTAALSGSFPTIAVNSSSVGTDAENRLKQLCLAPVDDGQLGGFSMPATGVAYLCRGGSYKTGSAGAGLFAMRFVPADASAEELADVGTRFAYV